MVADEMGGSLRVPALCLLFYTTVRHCFSWLCLSLRGIAAQTSVARRRRTARFLGLERLPAPPLNERICAGVRGVLLLRGRDAPYLFFAGYIMSYLERHTQLAPTMRRVVPLLISFVANALVCTLIELVMGLALNMDYALWDYRDMFCNFMGQVCLQNAIAFGIAATLMTWVIYPAVESGLRKLPSDVVNTAFVGVAVGLLILIFLYYVNVVVLGLDISSDEAGAAVEVGWGEEDAA